MSLVSTLRAARTAPQAMWLVFAQEYFANPKRVFCFYEGSDDFSVYPEFVREAVPAGWRVREFWCKGKPNVYSMYARLDWSVHDKRRCLFFVDKDLAEYLPTAHPVDTNIFVTRYYSIENYVVTNEMLEVCLRQLLDCFWPANELQHVFTWFERELAAFHAISRTWMVWILAHKIAGHNVPLEDTDPGALVRIDENLRCVRRNGVSAEHYLSRQTGLIANPVRVKDLLQARRQLTRATDPKLYVRGKYELWFFVAFLRALPDHLEPLRSTGEPRISLKVQLECGHAMRTLGPRLRLPADLYSFLFSNLGGL